MASIPKAARGVMEPLGVGFLERVFARVVVLEFATILTTGRRTMTNFLCTVQSLAPGGFSTYQRVTAASNWRS